MTTAALALEGVSIRFGGIRALEDLSCEVPAGQLRGIIGPNGSGKTTLLNVISRIHPVSAGAIRLFGEDVTRWPNHAVARRGVMRTYQRAALVDQLTVLENVMLGLHATRRQPLLGVAFRTPAFRRLERECVDRARETLEFVGIAHLADRKGDELSGGQMRLVEIARAVAPRPRVLLLDEPAAGLSLVRIDEIADLIRRINGELGGDRRPGRTRPQPRHVALRTHLGAGLRAAPRRVGVAVRGAGGPAGARGLSRAGAGARAGARQGVRTGGGGRCSRLKTSASAMGRSR